MKAEIKKWGNSAALRLPSRILAQAHISVASAVDITVEEGRIIVQPTQQKRSRVHFPYSEEQLLKGLNADNAHADEMASVTQHELGE